MISKATLKTIDPIVRTLSGDRLYTSYQLSKREYIGTTKGHRDTIDYLRNCRYEHAPSVLGIGLEAAKTHPETKELHWSSYRKVDPKDAQRQFHVHLWLTDDGRYELFSHREMRPDLKRVGDESFRDTINRLRTHYRPEWGESYELGAMDPALEGLLE